MGDQKEKYPGEFAEKWKALFNYAFTHNCGDCILITFCQETDCGGVCDYLEKYFKEAKVPKDQQRLF